MRTFSCTCGNTLYFDNTECLNCGSILGFDPLSLRLIPLAEESAGNYQSQTEPQRQYRLCKNYTQAHVCNWLVPANDENQYCQACRLNAVIPDLTKTENYQRWYKLERAKRRLIYTLLTLRLSLLGKDRSNSLSFRFMEDVKSYDIFSEEMVTYEQIMTGHRAGVVTINIIEADDSEREKIRENMNEMYRTILGHFRHESGHYYWDQLIAQRGKMEEFRDVFGDERKDYESSLKNYYQNGPRDYWYNDYISAYASAHPWEDWAETWAHYLHFVDILETASHHHVGVKGKAIEPIQQDIRDWLSQSDFKSIISRLSGLMETLNELNRSLGLPDPYPFEHSPAVVKKLEYIHTAIMACE